MKATDILMSEHRIIEKVLTILETAASRLKAGENVRPGFFLDASEFIRGFADGCHHKKEEGVLFKSLENYGLSPEQGPIAVMLHEHEMGRQLTRGMREAAMRLEAGDASARDAVAANALGYVNLLRGHIAKEDGVLFPLSAKVIPVSQQEQVAEDFERVEHEETGEGVHEKYLGLASALESEMNPQRNHV